MKHSKIIILIVALLLFSSLWGFNKFFWKTGRTLQCTGNLVKCENNALAVANGKQLYLYDIIDIYNLRLSNAVEFEGVVNDIAILSNKEVIAALSSHSNLMSEIDTLDTRGRKMKVKALTGSTIIQEGTNLYLGHPDEGLTIYDIGRNFTASIIGTYHHDWGLNALAVKWPFAYAGNDYGVTTINLKRVNRPLPFGENYDVLKCTTLAYYNDIVLAGSNRTLNVIDVSIPGKMVLNEQIYAPYKIDKIRVYRDEVFLIEGQGGLEVYSIGTNGALKRSNSYNDGSVINDIAFYHDYVFLLRDGKEVVILEYK